MKDYESLLEGLPLQEVIEKPTLIATYRETLERVRGRLVIGYPVPDNVEISILGNNRLREDQLRLRPMDREPLTGITNPGKSAHITCTRSIALACILQLGRPARRQDRLYIIPAPSFREIGFTPTYLPTPKRPLHVRIVPHRLNPEGDIYIDDRIELVNLLQKHQITRN